MNNILEIKNLYKNYQTKKEEISVLQNINLKVKKNDFIGIVGPSGVGKSSLLSIIAGLEKPSKGEVIKNNITISYMLQEDGLMSFLNILDNCLLGLRINKKINKHSKNEVIELLTKYGLKDYIYSYPNDLSGGQRQRVNLIRSLALKPDLILLDEPFSKLDYKIKNEISIDVRDILKKENKSLIMVTHDIEEALNICDKIIVLGKKEKSIKGIYIVDNKDELYKRIWSDLND